MSNSKGTVLVTGNCGYVGSVLTNKLIDAGYTVLGYDILMHGKDHLSALEESGKLQMTIGDIRDSAKLEPLVKAADTVIHLAGIIRVDNCLHLENEMDAVNRDASIALAELCKKHGKKMVFASSCSVYGLLGSNNEINETAPLAPTTIYARTKLEAEKGIIATGADVIICRFATAYGHSPRPRYDLFINEVLRDAFVKKQITLFDPLVWRCYIHTQDMADAVIFLMNHQKRGHTIYNVGSNAQNLTKDDIIKMMQAKLGNFQIDILRDKKDPRDYRINFDRIESEGFTFSKNVDYGIEEMRNFLAEKTIDPYDQKFTNYK